MLSTTQFLIFEIGSKCNLGHIHTKCPNSVRVPTSPNTLTDELILQCVDEAYTKFNFTGLIGWHYYNEPMLEYKRIFSLMERYPKGRYILWTNGLQPEDSRISLFEQVYCTNYNGMVTAEYYKGCKNVSISSPKFDERLKDTKNLLKDNNPCFRQYIELIIDNWGTTHLCCQDWQGEIKIGNLWEDTFTTLVLRRYKILEQMRKKEYPERCLRCKGKVRLPCFDKNIYRRTIEYAK